MRGDDNTIVVDGEEQQDTTIDINTSGGDGFDPDIPDRWYLIRDSRGFGSVTLTMVLVGFFVTTIAYLVSIIAPLFGLAVPFDGGAAAGYFVPILTAYVARRWKDK